MELISDHIKNKGENGAIETIDLSTVIKTLLAHKWIIALSMLFCLIFSIFYLSFKVPVYQTSALVQINNQGSNNAASLNLFSGSGLSPLGGSNSQSDIEMTLINSQYILNPVISALALDISIQPKYFPLVGHYFANQYQGETPAPAKWGFSSYAWGGENVKIALFTPPFNDRMEKYSLIAEDRDHYQLISPNGDLILKGKVGQLEVSRTGDTTILVNQLDARVGTVFYIKKLYQTMVLENLRSALSTTELGPSAGISSGPSLGKTGIVQLSMNNENPEKSKEIIDTIIHLAVNQSSNQQAARDEQTLGFIQAQLPIAKNNLTTAETELNTYQAKTGIISLTSQSQMLFQQVNRLDNEITMNEMNKTTLLQSYTQKDPIIQNINTKIEALNTQKLKIQAALLALPLKDQKVVDLMRSAKANLMTYNLLVNKYQQTLLMKESVTSDVQVLTYAQIPDEPLPNHAPLIVLASLLVGLIAGSLIVMALHFLTAGITDPYWTEKELGIRTLAIIPFSKSQAKAKKAFDRKETASIPILAKNDPSDVCIESIRSLRTNLLLTIKGQKNNIVSIGGIIPQTGKSFISVNLAVILSESGKRVLLIDADMRRGYLNQYFKLAHSPGLSKALEAAYPLEKIIRRTPIENLDFMSTGIFPLNPSELLLTERFEEILKIVSSQYDVVVIDAPPILAVNDASLIAQKCGTNFIVIPGGQLKAHEIESAVRRFYNDGVKITGSLFNFAKNIHQKTSSHGHSYSRYAQYDKRTQ